MHMVCLGYHSCLTQRLGSHRHAEWIDHGYESTAIRFVLQYIKVRHCSYTRECEWWCGGQQIWYAARSQLLKEYH